MATAIQVMAIRTSAATMETLAKFDHEQAEPMVRPGRAAFAGMEGRGQALGWISKGLCWDERIRNDYVTLDFIASNTTIPVPKVLEYTVRDDAATLVLERIYGETLDSFKGVEKDIAFENALVFLEERVLPQLRQLRSSKPGGLTALLFHHIEYGSKTKGNIGW
ncbi:hypothetical protein DL98DRAFT_594462 [Cadophora sp. DSE1049]|nr:hypothetical protein DL98DRAFT_594462 [Cadophora sp. DSE1049]